LQADAEALEPVLKKAMGEGDEDERMAKAGLCLTIGTDAALRAISRALTYERRSPVRVRIRKTLDQVPPERILGILAEMINREEPGDRVIGANTIGLLQLDKSAKALEAGLDSKEPRVLYSVVAAMGRVPDKDVVPTLSRIADSFVVPWTVRARAVTALGKHEAREAIPSLLVSATHPEAELAKAAIEVLGQLKAGYTAPLVASQLNQPELAGAAAIALVRMGAAPVAIPIVESLELEGMSGHTREQVLWALSELKDETVVSALGKQLVGSDSVAAVSVIQTLGRIGHPSALVQLVPLLEHESEDVRAMSLWSLEKITGEKLGPERAAWEAWAMQE
jgi:HEAT repeat protein